MNYTWVIDIIGLILSVILFFNVLRIRKTGNIDQAIFKILLVLITCIFLCDIPAWIIDKKQFNFARELNIILNTLYYLFQILYCYFWVLFNLYRGENIGKPKKSILVLTGIVTVFEIIVILINPFTSWIFSVSDDNVYSRGIYYLHNLGAFVFYIILAITVVLVRLIKIKDGNSVLKKQTALMLIYMFLPLVGTAIQMFYYGLSLLWPFTVLSMIMIYLNTQQEIVAKERVLSSRLERELSETKMTLMMSQIQPQFLYNSLNAIADLCNDNEQAKNSLISFSKYLRGNIDSINQNIPLSFESELNHAEIYINLEKLRYKDKINVVYDLKEKDFVLPSLTIQPLFENAVKYGIILKENGGTITLTTKRHNSNIVVEVADDGLGFDATKMLNDEDTICGINNVRKRLELLLNGSLEIVSEIGKGTTVKLIIPIQQ